MTYSIVARDGTTGALGAAVQTHWFCTGAVVPWVRPGVGAVCTQSIVEPAYGPELLDALARGVAPPAALAALVAADDAAAVRQVAAVDAGGATAVHTGADCIAHAGDIAGEGCSAQANMMAATGVPEAMLAAFEASAGAPLERRLLAALAAAEAAGGDVRGRQSGALLVAPASGEPWRRSVDLRVDDAPEPLAELARLLDLHEAYAHAEEADRHLGRGDHAAAGAAYERALALAPDSDELLFWAGIAAARGDDLELALARVRAAVARHAGWQELLRRLGALAPAAARVHDAL